jgi:hypothetical protein
MSDVVMLADWQAVWPRIVALGVLGLLIGVPIGAIWSKRRLTRRLDGIEAEALAANDAGVPPLVEIEFHTYHGFLAYATQRTHRVTLSAPAARRLLERLHRFNCTWGLLALGGPFIPLLSKSEYKSQLRRISTVP